MKKLLTVFMILFLVVGCTTKQKSVEIRQKKLKESVDLKAGFGIHHIEEGYVYDGEPISVDYDYEVEGRDTVFGLMIFVNGVPQKLSNQHAENEVYVFKGKKEDKKTKQVTFVPNTGNKGEKLNMHAFLIADYEVVSSLKDLRNKQHVMSCGTTTLTINKDINNLDIKEKKDYQVLDYTEDLLSLNKEDDYFENNLLIDFPKNKDGTYNKNEEITIKVTGRSDTYRIWILEDLKPSIDYYVSIPMNKSIQFKWLPHQKSKNIKVIAIPLSQELPEESGTLVVK